ncbi:MAG TPA: Ig-like domain-containing protein [Gemmatimonadaceae bacterium]|nr:Ig-like domain-containing protein [Gemmatimonadaceae bacterium]
MSISIPLSLVAGQKGHATATPKDANGNSLTDRAIAWYSSTTTVASVDDAGNISAVAPGQTVLSAVVDGVSGQAAMAVTPPPPTPIATMTVSLAPSDVTVGGTAQATAILKDSSGNTLTGRTITWTTSDGTVATVDATGRVKGIKGGKAMINAASEGKSSASQLTVDSAPAVAVASVAVSPASASVQVGSTTQLSATTSDASGNTLTGRAITWSSSNGAIATVSSNGLVTGASAGSVQITATSEGQTGSSTITVTATTPVPVATVTVSPSSTSLNVGANAQLSATTRDASGNTLTGRVITWSSSNSNVASVNANTGLVTAVAAGSAQVTATSEGKTGSASVTVIAPAPAPVATVTVSPSSTTLTVGNTAQLTATTRDANGNTLTGRVVSWSSSNSAVASVNANSGLVTAVAAGSAQITATSETKTGAASVTVNTPPPPPPPGSSNEPSGMSVIADRAFNSLSEAPWDTDNSLSIVQDPTAPKSPQNVLRATFPSGFAGGSSNGHTGMQWGGHHILYISYWMKYSSNWWGHNTGINKQAYAWVDEGGGYTPFVMEAEGVGSGPLKPRPILQRMVKGDGNYEPNLVPSATIQRDTWFRIEIVLTGNSSGTADGAMDIYLDGVHVTNATGLQWTNGATTWFIFELYPVWGGIGDSVPATMWAQWDHVYLSGK